MKDRRQLAFWLGFVPSAATAVVIMSYVQFSSQGNVALCTWAQSCDGGDVWIGYRVALAAFLFLNIPVFYLWTLIPGSESVARFQLCFAGAVVLSAVFWWVLASICARVRVWKTTRRTVLIFTGVYLLVAYGALSLARYIQYYNEAIHG